MASGAETASSRGVGTSAYERPAVLLDALRDARIAAAVRDEIADEVLNAQVKR